MTASSSVPSPAQQGSIVKITDEGIASYIEFPKDTIFMEALAQNASFNSGIAYVPVQRLVAGVKESHLYTIVPGMKEATHVAGPIAAPDGSTDVTIFGCHLTTAGILYLCAFNRNSILALDLTSLPVQAPPLKITCQLEIPHIASPNDVCVDPNDESILYVAGGTVTRPLLCCFLLPFSNSAYGMVYKIKLSDTSGSASTSFHITKQAGGLKTLAGVEVIDGKIVLAQLFNIVQQQQSGGKEVVKWVGNDGQGQVWLADNIDTAFDGKMILCPAYSTISKTLVDAVMNRSRLTSFFLLLTQIMTACSEKESLRTALLDPEVALSFSNTYIVDGEEPAPVRLIFLTRPSSSSSAAASNNNNTTMMDEAFHFEVDLSETRSQNEPYTVMDPKTGKPLGKRHFFNEQVTHASHLGNEGSGYIACINFEQPRVLLLKDDAFRKTIFSTSAY